TCSENNIGRYLSIKRIKRIKLFVPPLYLYSPPPHSPTIISRSRYFILQPYSKTAEYSIVDIMTLRRRGGRFFGSNYRPDESCGNKNRTGGVIWEKSEHL
ncbi:MAG: hypothetical protein KAJ46_05830, partial [Sedimentisphaerales bacterium]|nr:hypothetical protein [Sedimentisphaerales bacterium]